MQLAPLQLLVPVVVVGGLSWCVGAAAPEPTGRRWRALGMTLLVVCAVLAFVYATFVGIGAAMEDDPALVGVVVLATMLGLTLVAVLASARRDPPTPEETQARKDDDGGGGTRRPKPSPPRRPTPPAPAGPGPSAPWDQFDDLRSQWERVPAGTR